MILVLAVAFTHLPFLIYILFPEQIFSVLREKTKIISSFFLDFMCIGEQNQIDADIFYIYSEHRRKKNLCDSPLLFGIFIGIFPNFFFCFNGTALSMEPFRRFLHLIFLASIYATKVPVFYLFFALLFFFFHRIGILDEIFQISSIRSYVNVNFIRILLLRFFFTQDKNATKYCTCVKWKKSKYVDLNSLSPQIRSISFRLCREKKKKFLAPFEPDEGNSMFTQLSRITIYRCANTQAIINKLEKQKKTLNIKIDFKKICGGSCEIATVKLNRFFISSIIINRNQIYRYHVKLKNSLNIIGKILFFSH